MSSQERKGWDAEVDWGEPVYLRSSFFGRQRDLAALQEMLADPSVRLITITGPSGVGKSRLAAQLYLDARDTFPDGIVFVSLSGVRDPELVLPFLAKALDLRDDRDIPVLDQLQGRLDGAHMLLVLDGFEHVLSASREITELLSRVSGPVVLATSRAPLRITAEHEYLLAPLVSPPANEKRTPARIDAEHRGRALRRPGSRGAQHLRADRGKRRGSGRCLSPARRSATGDRAGRRPYQDSLAPGLAHPAFESLAASHRRPA